MDGLRGFVDYRNVNFRCGSQHLDAAFIAIWVSTREMGKRKVFANLYSTSTCYFCFQQNKDIRVVYSQEVLMLSRKIGCPTPLTFYDNIFKILVFMVMGRGFGGVFLALQTILCDEWLSICMLKCLSGCRRMALSFVLENGILNGAVNRGIFSIPCSREFSIP